MMYMYGPQEISLDDHNLEKELANEARSPLPHYLSQPPKGLPERQ